MMGRNTATDLIVTVVFTLVTLAVCVTPPGKPEIKSCRSPEKETFTCWWEPGYDGGLPTTHSLYYRLENSNTVYECPDYHTAGENSCYFNKNDTSIWVNYNITVVATNRLGSSYSDPWDVDVVYIVQPHPPENVTVQVRRGEGEGEPYLRVLWEKPRNADTGSGWITLIYQLRVKLKNQDEWEEHDAGQQKTFNVYRPYSGGTYLVQVRCRPDHGLWSEWSAETYVQVPVYFPKERSMWIAIAVFAVFVFIILVWTLTLKRNSLKHCLLPPVPGPIIKGFDKKLLKSGKSEDMFNALGIPGFPHPSDYEDPLVEYLKVFDNEDQEMLLDGKDLQEGCLKSKGPFDNDSGRGSCDSHTLLTDKCGVAKEGPTPAQLPQEAHVKALDEMLSAETQPPAVALPEDAQSGAWPLVLTPYQNPQQGSPLKSVPGIFISTPSSPQLEYSIGSKHSKVLYELGANGMEGKGQTAVSSARTMEYVEVQKVNQQNVLLLRPLAEQNVDSSPSSVEQPAEDYSKVKGMTSDNVLLLQQEVSTQCLSDYQYGEDQEETCPMIPPTLVGKPVVHQPPTGAPGGMQFTSNGYVDTAMPIC